LIRDCDGEGFKLIPQICRINLKPYFCSFLTSHGIFLFFYDRGSIQEDFGRYGLVEAQEVDEPLNKVEGQPSQRFWQIICKKES